MKEKKKLNGVKTKMKFKNFLKREVILIEMPHITLSSGKAVDIELEVHTEMTEKEFIKYIEDWLHGKRIKNKVGVTMSVSPEYLKIFKEKLLKNDFFKNYVIKYYGNIFWMKVEKLLS